MSDPQAALLQCPAKSIRSILQVLLDLRKRQKAGEDVSVPLTTLQLRGGHVLSGWIVDLADDREGETILLQCPGSEVRSPEIQLTYVDPRDVASLTVHQAGPVLAELSFGRVAVSPGQAPGSLMDIRRKADESAQQLAQAIGRTVAVSIQGDGFSREPGPLGTVMQAMQDAFIVLKEIAQDDLGKEALAEKLRKVQFAKGRAPAAAWEDGTLEILIGGNARLSRPDLKEKIAAGL